MPHRNSPMVALSERIERGKRGGKNPTDNNPTDNMSTAHQHAGMLGSHLSRSNRPFRRITFLSSHWISRAFASQRFRLLLVTWSAEV